MNKIISYELNCIGSLPALRLIRMTSAHAHPSSLRWRSFIASILRMKNVVSQVLDFQLTYKRPYIHSRVSNSAATIPHTISIDLLNHLLQFSSSTEQF